MTEAGQWLNKQRGSRYCTTKLKMPELQLVLLKKRTRSGIELILKNDVTIRKIYHQRQMAITTPSKHTYTYEISIIHEQTWDFGGPIQNNVKAFAEYLSPPLYQTQEHHGIFQSHGLSYFVSLWDKIHLYMFYLLLKSHDRKSDNAVWYDLCMLSSSIRSLFLWP